METEHYLRAVDQMRKACPLVELQLSPNVIQGVHHGETVISVAHLRDRTRLDLFRMAYYRAVESGCLKERAPD